jgi:uncharacterized OB-fold protein
MTASQTPMLPRITAESEGYWAHASRGVLAIPTCDECGHRWFPPSPACPACLSERVACRPVSGRGRLWSWVVMHRPYFKAFPPPYLVAMVVLDEGPMVTTALVAKRAEDLKCDMPVRAVFEPAVDGRSIVRFEPEPS